MTSRPTQRRLMSTENPVSEIVALAMDGAR